MRDLAIAELSEVSGGQIEDDDPFIQDPITVVTTPQEANPWMSSVTLGTVISSGQSFAEFIFGADYDSLIGEFGDAAQNALDAAINLPPAADTCEGGVVAQVNSLMDQRSYAQGQADYWEVNDPSSGALITVGDGVGGFIGIAGDAAAQLFWEQRVDAIDGQIADLASAYEDCGGDGS